MLILCNNYYNVGHWIKNTFLRRFVKTVMWLVVAVLVLPLALYIPPLQDALFGFVVGKVNDSADGLTVSYDHLRLRWPLTLEAMDVDVLTAPSDTMAHVGQLRFTVEALPLLALRVCARAEIDDVLFKTGHPDSSMWLKADVGRLRLDPSTFHIVSSTLDISEAELSDARVRMIINPDTVATPPDSASASSPLKINADRLVLNNIDFAMTMMPTIDSLGVVIGNAGLDRGAIDLGRQTVDAHWLSIDSVAATYLLPQYAVAVAPVASPADTVNVSLPWTITADHISLSARNAVYGVRGHVPQPGLDMEWIEVSGVDIEVDSFYNRATTLTVPLKHLSANERSGLHLTAAGRFAMDSTAMHADSFRIATYFSDLTLDAKLGVGDLAADPSLPLSVAATARIGLPDIKTAMPSLTSVINQLPPHRDIMAVVMADGTVGNLNIETISLSLPGYFGVEAAGDVAGLPVTDNLDGDISISGRVNDTPLLKSKLVRSVLGPGVELPPMTLRGDVKMRGGVIDGDLTATTGAGRVALDARWNGRVPAYRLNLNAADFPVNAFLPTSGIGSVSATANVEGRGLDFTSPRTKVSADVALGSLSINNRILRDINARASLDSCRILADISSTNPDADLNVTLSGRVESDTWHTTVSGTVRNLDMQALGLSASPLSGSMGLGGNLTLNPAAQLYRGHLDISKLNWSVGDMKLATSLISLDVDASDSLVSAGIVNGDFDARLVARSGLTATLARLDSATMLLNSGLAHRCIEFDSLQRLMPKFDLTLSGGANSLVGSGVQQSDINFRRFRFNIANDSAVHAIAWANGLQLTRQRIDSVAFTLSQRGDSMLIGGGMYNRPGTFDQFATVRADGVLTPRQMSLMLDQKDISSRTGYRLGFDIMAHDSVLQFRLLPENPIINYSTWTLNPDNYIIYDGKSQLIDADLQLSDGPSYLHILTDRMVADTTGVAEEVRIAAANIRLADWISVSPFAPPVNGEAGADIRLRYNPSARTIGGHGTLQLADFTYGKSRVGTFDLALDLSTNADKVVSASLGLDVDSTRVLTASGALNDSTARTPLQLSVGLNRFPLAIANPFLPRGTATLHGWLDGDMKASGTFSTPRLDGYLNFDSAGVIVGMLGTRFEFSPDPIRVDSGIVDFTGFSILGANNNPLAINGTVDLNSFSNPSIDLGFKASDMQILKSERKRGQDLYGKAFINLDATVKGNMKLLRVNADLSLLSGSNLTYVVGASTADIPSLTGSADVVKFVQFSDSTAVAQADSVADTGMAMLLNARLNIQEGTTINADLSATNAQDKAQIAGSGNLTFSMSPFADMRLTGRYNINSGFVRYSPPLMSQKNFKFVRGSYVAFNGDILNPTLNIQAVDQIRANVTETGQNSRLVDFDVILEITQTLDNMNLTFDLSTDDDMTVKNELQTMSADQRANQAMNLLLYNVYTGPGTKGSANTGNPLYSFLASTLNSWAANNIKGVELTFGVDQYDRTYNGNTSTATSYNYQLSKSFINDRLKIVVGGNYTDDSGAGSTQDYKQTLINDISFEYMLNNSGTMYVRLFRHTGFESILEGEVTQTGVGFVYRRKLGSLYSLLPRFMRPHRWRRPDRPLTPEQILRNTTTDSNQETNAPATTN